VKPEEKARANIDALLKDAGWVLQDYEQLNRGAGMGVVVREFPLKEGFAVMIDFVACGTGSRLRIRIFALNLVRTSSVMALPNSSPAPREEAKTSWTALAGSFQSSSSRKGLSRCRLSVCA
jgi:hypothetical protein